jgi:hypothetical protein
MSGSTPRPRPYPLADLARALGIPTTNTLQLAQALHLDRRNIMRARHRNLTTTQADHWAARANLHPDIIWDTWNDDDTDPAPLPDEDDPPIDTLQPITPERLAALRRPHPRDIAC